MPPKAATEAYEGGFSPAQTKLIAVVVRVMDGIPTNVDWSEVAKQYGYKDAGMARQKFGKLKTSIKKAGQDNAKNQESPTKATGKRSGSVKENTPKRLKKSGKKGIKVEDPTEDEDESPNVKEEYSDGDQTLKANHEEEMANDF